MNFFPTSPLKLPRTAKRHLKAALTATAFQLILRRFRNT